MLINFRTFFTPPTSPLVKLLPDNVTTTPTSMSAHNSPINTGTERSKLPAILPAPATPCTPTSPTLDITKLLQYYYSKPMTLNPFLISQQQLNPESPDICPAPDTSGIPQPGILVVTAITAKPTSPTKPLTASKALIFQQQLNPEIPAILPAPATPCSSQPTTLVDTPSTIKQQRPTRLFTKNPTLTPQQQPNTGSLLNHTPEPKQKTKLGELNRSAQVQSALETEVAALRRKNHTLENQVKILLDKMNEGDEQIKSTNSKLISVINSMKDKHESEIMKIKKDFDKKLSDQNSRFNSVKKKFETELRRYDL